MTSTPITRRKALKGIAVGTAGFGFSGVAGADRPCSLNWRSELNRHKPPRSHVINVTQSVENDIDSGFNGYWAYDDYERLIQVWETGPDEYRAIVTYMGQFDAVACQPSPGEGGGDPLTGDEDGTMHGGYAATIDTELLGDPAWATNGNVGTFDYEGNVEAGTFEPVDWVEQYFGPDYDFSFEWWGWIYQSGCGTWVNAQGGSCGDILCAGPTNCDPNPGGGR